MILPSAPELLYTAPRAGYLPGEQIQAEVFGPDGTARGRACFYIEAVAGSGFAGQVYRASMLQAEGFPFAAAAIKVMRPRSGWKTALRDGLFWLCFQAPFAPRLREECVRAGLAWQSLLCAFTPPGAIARPYGYYWDAGLGSFVEIHEWVEGRAAQYAPDEWLLARLLGRPHPPPADEMSQLKAFMDRLADLCRRMGAEGLARQYEWYTLVSQANVLVRLQPRAGESQFTAIDCRPGLAIPFFLPVSPAHARIILLGLRRGRLTHYDEINLGRLSGFLASQPQPSVDLSGLVEQLRRDETAYRASLPDLWHTRTRLLRDSAFRARVRQAILGDWVRCGQADPQTAARLADRPARFLGLWLVSLLPLLGALLLRLVANPRYREHFAMLWGRPAYRRAALASWQTRDLTEWEATGRIPTGWKAGLRNPVYLLHKTLLSWLPVAAHRFLSDPAARARSLDAWFLQPIRLLTRHSARVAWLEAILLVQFARGMFSQERLDILLGQVREPHIQGFIRDLGFCAGLDIFSRLVYLGLAMYGVSTGNFLPLGLAVILPVPPSGPLRVMYVLIRLLADLPALLRQPPHDLPPDRLLLARLGALLIAPWRWVGNLFPLLEISTVYTRLSFVLVEYTVSRAAGAIPVFGGQGKLLEHAIFQLCYNLPLSIKHELLNQKTRFW